MVMMSMIGKIDGLMYATNHAEETARNLKKAGAWLKSKVSSSAMASQSPSSSPSPSTTTPSPSASAVVTEPTVNTSMPATSSPTATTTTNHGFVAWFMNDASMVDKMALVLVVILAVIAVIMLAKRAYTALTAPVDNGADMVSAPMNDDHGFSARGLNGHVNAHDVMDTAVARRNTNVR
jgi:hypothetical protein